MTDIEGLPGLLAPVPRPRLLDRQGWSTLVAGSLLLLISFTTNYGDDNLFQFGNLSASMGCRAWIASRGHRPGIDEPKAEDVKVGQVSRRQAAAGGGAAAMGLPIRSRRPPGKRSRPCRTSASFMAVIAMAPGFGRIQAFSEDRARFLFHRAAEAGGPHLAS